MWKSFVEGYAPAHGGTQMGALISLDGTPVVDFHSMTIGELEGGAWHPPQIDVQKRASSLPGRWPWVIPPKFDSCFRCCGKLLCVRGQCL